MQVFRSSGLARRVMAGLAVCATLALAACGQEPAGDTPEGISDELRGYLDGMNKELLAARQKVDALNQKVADLEGGLIELRRASAKAGIEIASEVSIAGVDMRGSADAKIAIIEFTDFECPYCSRHARETLPRIDADLIQTGLVRYGVKDFPISSHENARPAAIAARCAREQGKYWEMHTALFENFKSLGDRLYLRTASGLGMDLDRFEACLKDAEVAKAVDADFSYGKQLGVTGTPRFFVGRVEGDKVVDIVSINGAYPFDKFAATVERVRAKP